MKQRESVSEFQEKNHKSLTKAFTRSQVIEKGSLRSEKVRKSFPTQSYLKNVRRLRGQVDVFHLDEATTPDPNPSKCRPNQTSLIANRSEKLIIVLRGCIGLSFSSELVWVRGMEEEAKKFSPKSRMSYIKSGTG